MKIFFLSILIFVTVVISFSCELKDFNHCSEYTVYVESENLNQIIVIESLFINDYMNSYNFLELRTPFVQNKKLDLTQSPVLTNRKREVNIEVTILENCGKLYLFSQEYLIKDVLICDESLSITELLPRSSFNSCA